MVTLLKQQHLHFIEDDPVRPHIDVNWRVTHPNEVYALYEDQYAERHEPLEAPRAIICVAYTNSVATNEDELKNNSNPNTAMFYTVWSYDKGAGREIVNNVSELIKNTKPEINRHVTLSPKTEMARKFHINNGAFQLQENDNTINYEYLLT